MQEKNLSQLMKAGMRHLVSGVCVISAAFEDGETFAMTASSVTSVSDSPASLLVCINQQVSKSEEMSSIGQRLAVNLLSSEHEEVSNLCAGRDASQDRFMLGKWGSLDGTPVLTDSLVTFLCEVDQVVTYGTHHVVICKIHDVLSREELVHPLVYAQGRYGTFV